MKRNAGFSLVELVIVIVVLGLLAVAALPRFLDVTDKAKEASVEGVAGGFATAVLSARAQWEAEVRPNVSGSSSNSNYVDYDGSFFFLTSTNGSASLRDGYPISYFGDNTAPESGTAPTTITDNQTCSDLMNNLLQNPPKVGIPSEVTADSSYKYEAEKQSNFVCRYTQLEGTQGTVAHYFEYDVSKGSVQVTLN
ncbi:prepilin-type N-terminal cleavage/methylation domain-containing protein [Vibrio comitans]|uniref:MSHA pilin protein MshB n=1 Tax=Vibrio comitans NBRC 102076 TaxID=1219078 RepID=A0A4Y3IS46_9VIBR|nr:prepilin-type N-terminal cleavage/methylation domain-containing protein [Vibrio comitans]GEA62333.1 MSHA pilin protein MshB [Vibrio comitans NBRC 102076]